MLLAEEEFFGAKFLYGVAEFDGGPVRCAIACTRHCSGISGISQGGHRGPVVIASLRADNFVYFFIGQ
jgi:hypothetical protein